MCKQFIQDRNRTCIYQDLSSKKALAAKLYLETNNKQYIQITVTVNPLESV